MADKLEDVFFAQIAVGPQLGGGSMVFGLTREGRVYTYDWNMQIWIPLVARKNHQ